MNYKPIDKNTPACFSAENLLVGVCKKIDCEWGGLESQ